MLRYAPVHYSKGVFATPAQQPGCAPGLHVALFARLAHVGARLREAKTHPTPGSRETPLGFVSWEHGCARCRRAISAAPPRRWGGWRGLAREGEISARAGRRGPVKSPCAYICRWHCLFPPPLAARCSTTPLVRDRRRAVVRHGGVHLRRSSSPFPALELRHRAAAPPGIETPSCWASSSSLADLLPLLPDLLPLLPDLLHVR